MKSVIDIFWQTVNELKKNSGSYEAIRNPFHPLNSIYHPLRNPYHILNNPYISINNPFNPNRGREQAIMLSKLISEYVA